MSKAPSLPYDQIIRALQRDGWIVVRQKGSHIRLQKHSATETLKLTIPAHRPVKRFYPCSHSEASEALGRRLCPPRVTGDALCG